MSDSGSDSTAMGVSAGEGEDKQEKREEGIGIGECIRGWWSRNCQVVQHKSHVGPMAGKDKDNEK